MITWPTSLPQPNTDFGRTTRTSAARTKMDSGRIRQRRRFTRQFHTIKVSWKLTDDQMSYLDAVYHHLLNDGTDWFTMSLPMGTGFRTFTVRFVADSYDTKYDEVMYWNVSAQLETEDDVSPYSAEDIEALLAVDLDLPGFEAGTTRLHTFVHVTTPALE